MNNIKRDPRRTILILVLLIVAAVYTWLFNDNYGILSQNRQAAETVTEQQETVTEQEESGGK